jgi:signal transduction histidine kinase
MAFDFLFVASILTTLFSSAALAAFLWLRARSAPGAPQLALFVVVVGFYALGLLVSEKPGAALLSLAPLGAAVFVDFSTRLANRDARARTAAYLLGGGATAAQLCFGAGSYFTTTEGMRGFRYADAGLAGVVVAVFLAGYGHLLLAQTLRAARGKRRREIGLIFAASLLGLSSVASFAPPLFNELVAPWSILVLPIYPALLVYGVLRHEVMAANVWARRAAAYALLLGLAALLASLATAAPLALFAPSTDFATAFLGLAAAMTSGFALAGPIRRFADILVYFEADISAQKLADWRAELFRAETVDELLAIARRHLHSAMRLPVEPTLAAGGVEPALRCAKPTRSWEVRTAGFDDAPPGVRRIAIVYAAALEQSLDELDRRRARAEGARLAELGLLASTIAHDLRNPLNIVNMAAPAPPAESRAEILAQTRRMNRLVADLLDYARPWRIEPEDIDLLTAFGDAEVHVAAGAKLRADPSRFAQAAENLLANARAAGGRVVLFVEAGEDATLVHVCDDGRGVPDDIADKLFLPFVSRSEDGTGLGLAIVSKIMAAHGGSISLARREGFSTCLTLRFPT